MGKDKLLSWSFVSVSSDAAIIHTNAVTKKKFIRTRTHMKTDTCQFTARATGLIRQYSKVGVRRVHSSSSNSLRESRQELTLEYTKFVRLVTFIYGFLVQYVVSIFFFFS